MEMVTNLNPKNKSRKAASNGDGRGRVRGESSQEKIHWPQETKNSMYFQKMGTGQIERMSLIMR